MEFRAFERGDREAIENLFRTVFSESDSTEEGAMVGQLAHDTMAETNRADLYGFVAVDDAQIVGAVLFTRLSYDADFDVFILAPMAVHSERQREGIGAALINHGLDALCSDGVRIVTTYGDPAYYTRLGFQPLSADTLAPPYPLSQPIGWLGQALDGGTIEPVAGCCTCVTALANPAYW